MAATPASSASSRTEAVAAGMLLPWTVGELPPAPLPGWRRWLSVVGPGVLLAGASIGSGEWLFGPAVTAQYGGTVLWLATLSIVSQVFCNLEMLRYTLYCGEPIIVGYFRTWPGPMLWTGCYAILDLAAIWPYNVSNAAVILAAALLGHLPGAATLTLLGWTLTESHLVKLLSFILFLLAFVPLIFGGTIYKMLLRVMTFKLLVVLGYLTFFAVFMVSSTNAWEVCSGFFRVGMVPLRADTIIAGRHFSLLERAGATSYGIKGTLENGQPLITEFTVHQASQAQTYGLGAAVPPDLLALRQQLVARAQSLAERGGFFVEDSRAGVTLTLQGRITPDQTWQPQQITLVDAHATHSYARLEDVPEPYMARARALTVHQGLEEVSLWSYWRAHGRLPNLDWAMLAAFAAIAGAGGLSNTLYSSFARDKGWGMGAHVGAIPSLIGSRTITLSHVGKAFRPDAKNRPRWRGWMRYIIEDQLVVWMLCNFLGMALPCMLSLEFIRHAPVTGNRVAALTAEGMAQRYPEFGPLLWFLTLLCGFLVLFPGQILSGDILARRWTDIIWTSSTRAHRLQGHQVKYVYYGIMLLYAAWGLVALATFDPLQIAKIGAVLMNVALGFSALHTLYVNRTLLPRELRPNGLMQAGVIGCGVFFLGISVIVFLSL
ncbi:MAG: Nramp family divalent metal transporter [Gemmataceae bacterium]|nr:Nramp family divalent metal transporter [Gemmataceae bacterium]